MGQVMRETKGKASPPVVQEIVSQQLAEHTENDDAR